MPEDTELLREVIAFTRCIIAMHVSSGGDGWVVAISEAERASMECKRKSYFEN